MRLFFNNFSNKNEISYHKPLESSVWQALDIFKNLPDNDGSYFGLIDRDDTIVYFSKFDKYFWVIDIPVVEKYGAFIGYFTREKCVSIIKELFDEKLALDISGLSFEKYL